MTRRERKKKIEKMRKYFSVNEICEMAGISRPTFYAILEEKGVQLKTLEKMEENLKASKKVFLEKMEKDFDIKLI